MAKIKFKSLDEVKKFVSIAEKYDSPVDVHMGRYNCDGSSLMGILGLDLTHILEVEMLAHDNREKEQFLNDIKEFCVEE